jgi:uncharacterized membrane-anchored protein YhcB (DUF1043 family)
MSNLWLWLKEKWKLVGGVILGFLGILSIYLRSKNQKKVLQKANESHEKDIKINNEALKEMKEGLSKINQETTESLEKARKDFDEAEREVQKEKSRFIKDAAEDEELAKKIADHVGAKYIDND